MTAYPKKPLIMAHSGVSRKTRCLVVRSLLQLAYFVYARSKSHGKDMRTCMLVGAFATHRCNKNHLSCTDQFIVLIFHCGPIILFSYSVLQFE